MKSVDDYEKTARKGRPFSNGTTEPVFRQKRIGLCHPPKPHEIENRYRCIEARHEGVLFNPSANATWCLCGRVIRPGDCGRWPSPYERAEADASRPDEVGRRAREFLARAHGQRVDVPGPLVMPSESGEQFTLPLEVS
jgi:hypothetical protein